MFKTSRALRWHLLTGIGAIAMSACGGGEPTAVETGRSEPLAVASTPATSIPFYTVRRIDLGIAGGSVGPKGINAAGQVVGSAGAPPSGSTHAFFFDGNTTLDLGTLAGTSASFGVALNSSGQVTGRSEVPGVKAFSWTLGGGMVSISPSGISLGQAINDSGLVVGLELIPNVGLGGFAWTSGAGYVSYGPPFSRLDAVNNGGTMAGSLQTTLQAAIRQPDGTVVPVWPTGPSFAKLINDDGLVAGQLGAVSAGRAFAWKAGTPYPLGDTLALSGYDSSIAIELNQVGQVAGYASSSTSGSIAGFVWSPTAGPSFIPDFPGQFPSTLPRAINNHGQVVGAAGSLSVAQRAFTWTAATGTVDLVTRIVNPPAGLVLFDAMAISDNGSIVASGSTGLLLLTPASPNTPVPPTLGTIAANDPVAVGTPVNVSIAFTDFNTSDTHTAQWTWGDASAASAGTVTEAGGAGTASGSHVFSAAGVYQVSVTVNDSGGQAATVSRDVVVYDPAAGSVSGSGWFNSPMGAYAADTTLGGRADFGFVSKYKKGATLPSGQTTFQFQTAQLRFRSDLYDWLVVAGARAQYKGIGTLNGNDGYKFMLTAVDGALLGRGTPDRFRIKIWHFDADRNADVVDYDNQIDSGTEGGNNEGTAVAGGSIVISK